MPENAKVTSASGFDFGIPLKGMLVSTPDFSDSLHQACPLALSYGLERSNKLGAVVPSLSLVVQNEAPALAAFKQFEAWGSESDGDVVELALVMLTHSEYVLALGPELHRLIDRLSRYNRAVSPIAMSATWMYHMPISGPHLGDFFRYRDGTMRPFLFSASVLHGPSVTRSLSAVRPIAGLTPILKYDCHVVEPEDPADDPIVSVVRRRVSPRAGAPSPKNEPSNVEADPSLEPAAIAKHRAKLLESYFPVTMERLRIAGLDAEVQAALVSTSLSRWQIEQAICNLVLSQRLTGGAALHYEGLTADKRLETRIVDGLDSNVEELDGDDMALRRFKASEVLKQVQLDCEYLLNALGIPKPRGGLPAIQAALARRKLL